MSDIPTTSVVVSNLLFFIVNTIIPSSFLVLNVDIFYRFGYLSLITHPDDKMDMRFKFNGLQADH